MGNLNSYWETIKKELQKEAKAVYKNQPGLVNNLTVSEDNKHLLFLITGWHNDHYHHTIVYHFEKREGKIWLHANNTDEDVLEKFAALGIPKEVFYIPFLEEHPATALAV